MGAAARTLETFDPADADALARFEPEIEGLMLGRAAEDISPVNVIVELRSRYGLQLVTAKALIDKHWPDRSVFPEVI